MKDRVILFVLVSLLLCFQVNAYLTEVNNQEYFLDSKSKCTSNCGSEANPFRTFNESLTAISKSMASGGSSVPTLIVNQGDYFGEENKDININFDIDIVSALGSKSTIIDCQGTGYGFKLFGQSNILIKGLTIQNCVAIFGGGINSNNILSSFNDIIFINNRALQGSAIYTTSALTIITSCSFSKNIGEESTNAITIVDGSGRIESTKFFESTKDISCSNATIITSAGSKFASSCAADCQIIDYQQKSYCNVQSSNKACNNDNVCDSPIESIDSCPSDCFEGDNHVVNLEDIDRQPGWQLTYNEGFVPKPKPSFLYPVGGTVEYLDFPHIVDFMGKSYPPVSGNLLSDISVVTTSTVTFKLVIKNLAAIVLVNGRVLFDNYFYDNMPTIVHERSLLLSSRLPYKVRIVFTAINDQQRDLSFYWKSESNPEYTLVPSYFTRGSITPLPRCGDNICNEEPESCLIDCYDQIENECPAQSPPSNLQEFYGPVKDTLGQLLNNQYIFSLPGVGYLSHGMNLLTGEALPAQLFALNYCDNSSFSIVHAPHRGLVYSVPQGLHAQISPKCTMDTTTKKYSSSSQMAKEMSADKSFDVSLSGSYGGFFAKVSVSASLSMSESVKKAAEMEKKTDGYIYHSELKCETSKVNMQEPFKFHPKFIRDVAGVYDQDLTKAKEKMKNVIKTYGSLYYKTATLGGKLEQVSVVSNSYERSKTSQEIDRSMDMSFSVSASSKILPIRGSASMSGSIDSKTSKEQQDEYEKNSKRSTLIVSGGQPGSYGEDDFNSLHSWARTLDMIPSAIDYQAGYIADIIPQDWNLNSEINAKKLWRDAEFELYRDIFTEQLKQQQEEQKEQPIYIDQETIQSLDKSDTAYYFPNCLVQGPVEITYIHPNTGETKKLTTTVTKPNLMIVNFNDTIGMQSIKFSQTPSPDTCDKISFYNLFSSRRYEMGFNIAEDKKLYEILYVPQNRLAFELSCEMDADLKAIAQVEVIGTLSTVQISGEASGNRIFKIFDNSEYIGDIKAVLIRFVLPPKHFKRMIKCKRIQVIQACPQGQSDCLPKNTVYQNKEGYTKLYESKTKTFNINSQDQYWMTVEPFGSF
ncbi:hypothetical protein CYY_007382 [Polysphondylium violaceum]|uniref:MACPF domain-containing protein n=1 Tax=Polysphondylium violaceum TaxID=133409 RepID=A0A8J4UY21_9MYCE|nr:hypothetical protein CYY_007382 [Polysphondylium violaceum]